MKNSKNGKQEFGSPLLKLMNELQNGVCNGVPVRLGRINQLMLTSGRERIDFLHDFEFTQAAVKDAAPACYYLPYHPDKNFPLSNTQEFLLECETNLGLLLRSLRESENIYQQIELLQTLNRLQGIDFDTGFGGSELKVTVADLLNEVYIKAGGEGRYPHWSVIRYAAALLNKVDIGLSDAADRNFSTG